ncbi:hypothetical protein [Leucobacter chinensis]|uniref:hypothetical protein n=1 Tax=Leucobacter chinensis TaxID=2851010 RepID=UPI001C211D5D|nr:hypothetical protein [Leucobacter chinensis]
MGRIIEKKMIGYRCEVRSCRQRVHTIPQHTNTTWEEQLTDLVKLVDKGWALVLLNQLRAYCPEHAARAFQCTCRTNKNYQHTCVEHSEEASAALWVRGDTPAMVAKELDRIGVFS